MRARVNLTTLNRSVVGSDLSKTAPSVRVDTYRLKEIRSLKRSNEERGPRDAHSP